MANALAFALFRRLFPSRPGDPDDPLTDEERRGYRRREVGSLLPFFTFVPLLGVAWFFALKGAGDFCQPTTPGTLYLVRPIPMVWALHALILGIISAAAPTDGLYRVLLRDRYPRYMRFCEERAGYDGWRAFRWLAAVLIAVTVIGFVAVVKNYARFEEAGVEIGRPLASRSTFYDYARVVAIEHRATFRAPNGNIIDRPHHVIVFDDGTSWSTRGGFRDPVPDLDEKIVGLVARRSGRAIVERP